MRLRLATQHRWPSQALRVVAFLLLTTAGCQQTNRIQDNRIEPVAATETPALPGKAPAQRVSQFVFYSDTPIKENAPILTELTDLREQVFKELRLPPSNNVVQIFLFDDQEKYERWMKYRYPELPKRRAFFIDQPARPGASWPTGLLVFTYRGEHIRQDLRHEITHALLHSTLSEVPIWLDEGLAEYYELPRDKSGINVAHMDAIRGGRIKPDLAQLERLNQVNQMGRPQYQESWAWVYFMMHHSTETRSVMLNYLQDLRLPNQAKALYPQMKNLFTSPELVLQQHLAVVDRSLHEISRASSR